MTSTDPSQGGPAEVTADRRSRGSPWHVALEPLIVKHTIDPLLRHILSEGVTSQTELLDKLCNHPLVLSQGGGPAIISMEKLRQWLKLTGLESVFARRTIYSLSPNASGTAIPAPPTPYTPPSNVPAPQRVRPQIVGDDLREFIEPDLGGSPEDRPDVPFVIPTNQ